MCSGNRAPIFAHFQSTHVWRWLPWPWACICEHQRRMSLQTVHWDPLSRHCGRPGRLESWGGDMWTVLVKVQGVEPWAQGTARIPLALLPSLLQLSLSLQVPVIAMLLPLLPPNFIRKHLLGDVNYLNTEGNWHCFVSTMSTWIFTTTTQGRRCCHTLQTREQTQGDEVTGLGGS